MGGFPVFSKHMAIFSADFVDEDMEVNGVVLCLGISHKIVVGGYAMAIILGLERSDCIPVLAVDNHDVLMSPVEAY